MTAVELQGWARVFVPVATRIRMGVTAVELQGWARVFVPVATRKWMWVSTEQAGQENMPGPITSQLAIGQATIVSDVGLYYHKTHTTYFLKVCNKQGWYSKKMDNNIT